MKTGENISNTAFAVVIPTYNEKENIVALLQTLLETYPQAHAIVVDDNSPDGTGALVENFKKAEFPERLTVLHRKERGRGSAGIAGFREALKRKAPFILEMDADFSHRPQDIVLLLQGLSQAEVVIGSRFVASAKDERSWPRKSLTCLANFYLSRILEMPRWDITSGFRAYRREVLATVLSRPLFSKGPSLVVETLYLAFKEGFYIIQVPITFQNRKRGASKLNIRILLQSLYLPYFFRRHH